MTLFNRPRREFQNVLCQLRKNDLKGTEIIIVDDGSTKDYSRIKDYIKQNEMPVNWVELAPSSYPEHTYRIGDYNNPALAWNTALDAAKGEIIVTLASDVMIPACALKRAKTPGRAVWCCGVIDLDEGIEFLGKNRLVPYGWFMSWNREYHDVRWDEEYLKGMAFDDNDFAARLALSASRVEIDLSISAIHQSHAPVAYSDGHLGHDINERYTHRKWGGVPWWGDTNDPLEVRKSHGGDGVVLLHVTRRPPKQDVVPVEGIEQNVKAFLDGYAKDFDYAVDFGAGRFEKLQYTEAKKMIGLEICQEYIKKYLPGSRGMTPICADMCDYREFIEVPKNGERKLALMIDSLEHIEKDEGRRLLESIMEDFDRLIVITPSVWTEQDKDVWGCNNKHQRHRSMWTSADLEGAGMRVLKDYNRLYYAVWDRG